MYEYPKHKPHSRTLFPRTPFSPLPSCIACLAAQLMLISEVMTLPLARARQRGGQGVGRRERGRGVGKGQRGRVEGAARTTRYLSIAIFGFFSALSLYFSLSAFLSVSISLKLCIVLLPRPPPACSVCLSISITSSILIN